MRENKKITAQNYLTSTLVFRDRQAGISEIFDPRSERFKYNAYCVEKKILKELFSAEYDFLDDAVLRINDEFGSWELQEFSESGCGNCAAKK